MDNKPTTSFNISFWIFIIVAILLVIFSVQNSSPINVQLVFWNVNISLAILLIGTFLTGLVAGSLYAYSKFKPRKQKLEEHMDDSEIVIASEDLDENI